MVEGLPPTERKVNINNRLYIAYGSNLNVEQMMARCPGARVLGTAKVPDYQLLFKGSKSGSYLTIEPKAGSEVPVAVWEINPRHERALDLYEGFPTFYYKKEMVLPVTNLSTGKTRRRRVFAYIMHEERCLGIPSQFYVDTCVEGYEAFDFDLSYLESALNVSREALA